MAARIPSTELKPWTLFDFIKPEILQNVSLAYIFKEHTEAVIITSDHNAYHVSENTDGHPSVYSLFMHMVDTDGTPKLNFNKIAVAANGSHFLALTDEGQIFGWGNNNYGQLGFNNKDERWSCYSVPETPANIPAKIVDVACGFFHSLALTEEGDVFATGSGANGQLGIVPNKSRVYFKRVILDIELKKVVSIACCSESSFCVTDSGEVYSWGKNDYGQLGLGDTQNRDTPCLVTFLQTFKIKKLVCGYEHVLCLTDDGFLYAWGLNNCTQVHGLVRSVVIHPVRIATDLGNIEDVLAGSHSSICLCDGKEVYIWGYTKKEVFRLPTKTNLNSIVKASTLLPNIVLTLRPTGCPQALHQKRNDRIIANRIASAFNDPETSDLIFVVESKRIYVHKTILKISCEHFKRMFSSTWNENDRTEIEVKDFSYPVYYAFLKFIYTNEVDILFSDSLQLFDLAKSYLENDLRTICEEIIRKGLNMENFFELYASAIRQEQLEIEDILFNYALNRMNSIVESETFANLEDSIKYSFLLKASTKRTFKT